MLGVCRDLLADGPGRAAQAGQRQPVLQQRQRIERRMEGARLPAERGGRGAHHRGRTKGERVVHEAIVVVEAVPLERLEGGSTAPHEAGRGGPRRLAERPQEEAAIVGASPEGGASSVRSLISVGTIPPFLISVWPTKAWLAATLPLLASSP